MASIVNLRWRSSQELLAEVDLDALYIRQVKAIGATHYRKYPYMLLLHTGKIMIGIDLGQSSFMDRDFRARVGAAEPGRDENASEPGSLKETHE